VVEVVVGGPEDVPEVVVPEVPEVPEVEVEVVEVPGVVPAGPVALPGVWKSAIGSSRITVLPTVTTKDFDVTV
jgi:hypothetical protein